LLRAPSMRDVVDNAVPETCHRVIASVFDGDAEPLYEAILDRDADEFVRSCMCQTLAMLAVAGKIPREDAREFLRRCFSSFQAEQWREGSASISSETCYVWSGWQGAIALLGLEELVPLVKEAFEREFIDPRWLAFHHFEKDLRQAREPGFRLSEDYSTFDDAIGEFSQWYGFSAQAVEDRSRARAPAAERDAQQHHLLVHLSADERAMVASMLPGERKAFMAKLERVLNDEEPVWQEQAINPHRHVGRNDPCPCGSGAKFKKCCLRNAA
jgi:hypothetical protein